ncbi:MAG: ABC transporter ATP-binding protein, partial [Marinilabiliaceae bacterium]
MTGENIIKVNNLKISFEEREVLKGVSFSARQGDVTVILGGSGSGKSTILKHLLRLYPVPSGTISIFGRDIGAMEEDDELDFYLKIGVFYQNGALLNSLSVAENVALPLEQHTSLPKEIIEDMVRTKLHLVNLEEAYYLYPSQLSGGMLKRAALARAIIMDPPLLFCDEPGASLDPVSLSMLDNLILKLRHQLGMTVIMITHEVPSIKRIADKVLFIQDGIIAFEGTLDQAGESDLKALRNFFNA